MDSLHRAKRFLAQKASKLALAAVPLAALAVSVPAHAGAVLNVSSGDCTASVSGSGLASCYAYQVSPSGGNANLNWVAMAGSGYTSGGSTALDFFLNDSGSGSISGGSIPISWDFTLTVPTGDVNYDLNFSINSGSYSYSQSGSGSGEIQGSSSIVITNPTDLYSYSMELYTYDTEDYSVNIPGLSSLDMNSGIGTVPEPSTILLTSIGGLALLFRRRKKKTS